MLIEQKNGKVKFYCSGCGCKLKLKKFRHLCYDCYVRLGFEEGNRLTEMHRLHQEREAVRETMGVSVPVPYAERKARVE